ncbi:hypothetical protein M0E87_00820 [Corynebacterium sp. CCM 9185]|uniref:Uncharacterized protein n=1 Tax=Corynebacterium marambiense TaxID=2765364 RepID=A0ABS0VYC4_9CORY|nr:hypothetical protein [Corynebacterium marambiense]MBI9001749.1 hypothetical protein [Corynebacterium marambiense]MCK7662213.1 hypothetical protein [Corynebacterium marambiense]
MLQHPSPPTTPLHHTHLHIAGGVAFAVCALTVYTPSAAAYTVTADTNRMVCTVDPEEKSSDVVQFWKSLEADARDQRLSELDAAAPGLRAAIETYDPTATDPDTPTPADLQRRIGEAGGTEGLGMLTTLTAEDAGVVSEHTEHKTEYTEQEAREAATAIGADPGMKVAKALWDQASTGPRLDEIKAELFTARTEEYNRTQEHLRQSLVRCADELKNAEPLPTWTWMLGGAAVTALLAITVTAFRNSRRPSRHST